MRNALRTLLCWFFALLWLGLASAQAVDGSSTYTVHHRYDDARRLVGTISSDPDGSGPLGFPATRTTYNSTGQVAWIESGELSAWQSPDIVPASWSGFAIFSRTEFDYDEWGRQTKQLVFGGGVLESVTQSNHDAFGRTICTVQRMNPSAFQALPADACTLGSEGAFGPDRVVRTNYDDFDRMVSIERAVGTPLQQTYQAYTYTDFHKPESVTDANGNRTEYRYDEFQRLKKIVFPSKDTVGAVSTSDFEAYSYDDNGNRLSLRKRDGQTINFTYDDLNRVTQKDLPGSAQQDVYYGYNLQDLQLYARFGSPSGNGIEHSYDGFGRLLSSTNTFLNKTITYDHDREGNRTWIEHPDTVSFDYAYDGLNRLESISIGGTALQIAGKYNAQGLLSEVQRAGAGAITDLAYDDLARLDSYTHDFSLAADDVSVGFSFNPVSQVIQKGVTNLDYVHDGPRALTGAYSVNGLNQYASVAGNTYTYDDNGNLTSDGETTYAYDVENRLVSVTGSGTSATLSYDPLGRLQKTVIDGAETTFLYDGDALIAEYDGTGILLRRYVHGSRIDSPLIWYEGSAANDARYFHSDHQGSIIAISDAGGAQIASNTYSPFGVPSNTAFGRFAYTGQVELTGLDLYYYKARIYDPALGRFLQTDPIGYEDQMNLYAYVHNDPLNATDPTGMQSQGDALIEGLYAAKREHEEGIPAEETIVGNRKEDAKGLANGVVNNLNSAMELSEIANPLSKVLEVATGMDASPDSAEPFELADPSLQGIYDAQVGIMAAALGGPKVAPKINPGSGALLGRHGTLFGRGGQAGGGIFNNSNALRVGYGWKGSAKSGNDVFRIAWGKSGEPGSGHIVLYTFKNPL